MGDEVSRRSSVSKGDTWDRGKQIPSMGNTMRRIVITLVLVLVCTFSGSSFAQPEPDPWTGSWTAEIWPNELSHHSATLSFEVRNGELTGSFSGLVAGSVTGSVAGGSANGTWKAGSRSGSFALTLTSNGQGFRGHWGGEGGGAIVAQRVEPLKVEILSVEIISPRGLEADLNKIDPASHEEWNKIIKQITYELEEASDSPLFRYMDAHDPDIDQKLNDARDLLKKARGEEGTTEDKPTQNEDSDKLDLAKTLLDREKIKQAADNVKKNFENIDRLLAKARAIKPKLISAGSMILRPKGEIIIGVKNFKPEHEGQIVEVRILSIISSRINTPTADGRRVAEIFIDGKSLNPRPHEIDSDGIKFRLPADGIITGRFVGEGNYGTVTVSANLESRFVEFEPSPNTDAAILTIGGVHEETLRQREANRYSDEQDRASYLSLQVSQITGAMTVFTNIFDQVRDVYDATGAAPFPFSLLGASTSVVLGFLENAGSALAGLMDGAMAGYQKELIDINNQAKVKNLHIAELFPESGPPGIAEVLQD